MYHYLSLKLDLVLNVQHKYTEVTDAGRDMILTTAPVLASQAEAIVDLGRTWPQHRIDIH